MTGSIRLYWHEAEPTGPLQASFIGHALAFVRRAA
jgi:hypothetical protein